MNQLYEQGSLFDDIIPYYKLKEPVILLEMFAGIGSQRKALNILGVKIDDEKSMICEWAYNSYCGYNAIHIKDKTDYSFGKNKEELIERIKGTSVNYNNPLLFKQLEKKPMEWLRNAYNNCMATHNLINIMEVKGKDLGELPTEQTSILTYSFPCQDLSLAGKRAGMATSQAEGGTRSGLLWEVERILVERERESRNLPTILIMENVPEVVGSGNIEHFKKWEERLRQFGYSNFVDILNGKDYGIPQNRRRCFMVSILGDYNYNFPCKMPLKYLLKDLLEKEVDEKYYLTDKMIQFFAHNTEKQKERGNGFSFKPISTKNDEVAKTITTRNGSRMDDNFIYDEANKFSCKKEKLSIFLNSIPIKNNTKKGYILAEKGDGIDISSRMESHRGTVQKGSCQTITCQGGENVGVVVEDEKDNKEQDM